MPESSGCQSIGRSKRGQAGTRRSGHENFRIDPAPQKLRLQASTQLSAVVEKYWNMCDINPSTGAAPPTNSSTAASGSPHQENMHNGGENVVGGKTLGALPPWNYRRAAYAVTSSVTATSANSGFVQVIGCSSRKRLDTSERYRPTIGQQQT